LAFAAAERRSTAMERALFLMPYFGLFVRSQVNRE